MFIYNITVEVHNCSLLLMTVAGEGTMLGLSWEIELQWDKEFLKSRLELKHLDPKLQVSVEPLVSYNLQGVLTLCH